MGAHTNLQALDCRDASDRDVTSSASAAAAPSSVHKLADIPLIRRRLEQLIESFAQRPNLRARLTRIFVYGMWVVLTLAALGIVWHYGENAPAWDDWTLVPVATGNQTVTLSWLWAPYNYHRIPLPKLYLAATYRLTGGNFKAPMYVNVLVLTATALALMLTARSLRGRDTLSDVFFPFLLLQWGQMECLLLGFAINLILSTALCCFALIGILKNRLTLVGVCLVLLPLCGGTGLLAAAPIGVWVFYKAIGQRSVLNVLCVALSAAVCASYLLVVGARQVHRVPPLMLFSHLTEILSERVINTYLQSQPLVFLISVVCFSILVIMLVRWLNEDRRRTPVAAGLCAAAAVALWLLLPKDVRFKWDVESIAVLKKNMMIGRIIPLGLIVLVLALATLRRQVAPVMIGTFLVLLGIAVSRRSFVESRYVTLTFPLWASMYFVLDKDQWCRSLLTVATIVLFVNAISYGENCANRKQVMQRDFMAAVKSEPWERVERSNALNYDLKWANNTLKLQNTTVLACIRMLQRIGHPAFGPLPGEHVVSVHLPGRRGRLPVAGGQPNRDKL